MRITVLTAALAFMIAVAPASAAIIGFNGLVTPGPFTVYSEAEFTVAAASGVWETRSIYGNPAPFIQFVRVAPEPTTTAAIELTSGGMPFRFDSVDLYASITPIPYVLVGLLNALPVFTQTGTVPNTLGNFATVTSNQATAIDTLRITLSNVATPCCGNNPVGLDNIVVNRVPEPGSVLLLGLGAAAAARRHARRRGCRVSIPRSLRALVIVPLY